VEEFDKNWTKFGRRQESFRANVIQKPQRNTQSFLKFGCETRNAMLSCSIPKESPARNSSAEKDQQEWYMNG